MAIWSIAPPPHLKGKNTKCKIIYIYINYYPIQFQGAFIWVPRWGLLYTGACPSRSSSWQSTRPCVEGRKWQLIAGSPVSPWIFQYIQEPCVTLQTAPSLQHSLANARSAFSVQPLSALESYHAMPTCRVLERALRGVYKESNERGTEGGTRTHSPPSISETQEIMCRSETIQDHQYSSLQPNLGWLSKEHNCTDGTGQHVPSASSRQKTP